MYGHDPSLSLLRVFGCLCYATILNISDKFGSRSEKSVFIGYSNEKKGYKLLSLETKNIFYSRDVKFYETVFPFKMKNTLSKPFVETYVPKDLNHKNFFDSQTSPNDEGRVTSYDDGTVLSHPTRDDEPVATSIDDNTHPEGTISHESHPADASSDSADTSPDSAEQERGLPATTVRRSTRVSKLPSNLNDFIVEGKVKYGVEKVVNYSNLNK